MKETKITVLNDGPIKIEGELTFAGQYPDAKSTDGMVFLCRCGASKNKPYCDGSHQEEKFKG